MTVEPASTRANRIISDSLDWSYIGTSFIVVWGLVGHSPSARRARLTRRPPRPVASDGQRYAGPGGVHMRGPRQCLRVYVLPDVRQPAVPDGNGEDEMVLESLVRGFDFPLSEADDQDPVSLRYEVPGFRGRFY